MKKLTILFAALTLSVGMAQAQSTTFYYNAGRELQDYFGRMGTVTDHGWHYGNSSYYVSVSGNITSIGEYTFSSCRDLYTIVIPIEVVSIGGGAFLSCNGLTSVTIPNSVTTIGEAAFKGCMSLTSITIPATVTTIGKDAFYNCVDMKSVTFEGADCQNAIGNNAFYGVGSADAPALLVLPDNWTGSRPVDGNTPWYGGYFVLDLTPYKQNALAAITSAMGDYANSAYLQSLVATEVASINSATDTKTMKTNRDAAIAKLTPIMAIYPTAFNEGNAAGKAEGIEEGKAEAKAELPTDPEGTTGHAVVITKGDKSVTLINPESVSYIKQE